MREFYKQLKTFGHVRLNESLAKHATFKIGGPTDFFIEVKEVVKLTKLLSFLSSEGIEYFILGSGSNILFSDERFEGVIIKLKTYNLQLITSDTIAADAGVLLGQVVDLAVQNSLSGMEWGVGIPGTVGGAVRGNAGAFGKDASDCIEKVEVWRDGEVLTLSRKECGFGYRESVFKHNSDVILQAWFKLVSGDKKKIVRLAREYLKIRTNRYPKWPNPGSFFKNIKIDKWQGKIEELPELFRERGTVPVGWLVEQVEMKGYTVGGAKVSDEHGNFIINFNHATSADVLTLIEKVKEAVYNKFGVEIEPEVQIL